MRMAPYVAVPFDPVAIRVAIHFGEKFAQSLDLFHGCNFFRGFETKQGS